MYDYQLDKASNEADFPPNSPHIHDDSNSKKKRVRPM